MTLPGLVVSASLLIIVAGDVVALLALGVGVTTQTLARIRDPSRRA